MEQLGKYTIVPLSSLLYPKGEVMAKNMLALTLEEVIEIADLVAFRQTMFQEDIRVSVKVALMNCGEKFTKVICFNGEWSGVKSDLPVSSGIPKCPNGHVLYESTAGRKRLGWVDLNE